MVGAQHIAGLAVPFRLDGRLITPKKTRISLPLFRSIQELSLKEEVIKELRGDVKADDDSTEGESINVPSNSLDRAAGGVFRAFPLLAAVVLESNRHEPKQNKTCQMKTFCLFEFV